MQNLLDDFLNRRYPADALKQCHQVEQAFSAVQYGEPIILTASTGRWLVYALETMPSNLWSELTLLSPQLLLMHNRLRYLGCAPPAGDMAFCTATGLGYSDIATLAGLLGSKPEIGTLAQSLHWQIVEHQLAQMLHIVAERAEILPAWILIPVDDWANIAQFADVDHQQLIWYNNEITSNIQEVIRTDLQLYVGASTITAFRAAHSQSKEHYAIALAGGGKEGIPLVRVHSSCYTGDLLGSLTCDCGEQLHVALAQIAADPAGGMVIYLQQEGRGIGLLNKLRCYAEQIAGLDTVEANEALGFADDARGFTMAASILKACAIPKIRLLSNNPRKATELTQAGIIVTEQVAHIVPAARHPLTQHYMHIKKQRLGHLLP